MQFLKEVFLAHAGAQNSGAIQAAGEQGGDMEIINNILSEIDKPVPSS